MAEVTKVSTEYVLNGEPVEYEIHENGYRIIAGDMIMTQFEPAIPYRSLGYEEGCLKHIEKMVADAEELKNEKMTIAEFAEKVLQNEANLAYIAMMQDIEL